MKFDVELVGKIGSMALIAKQAQIPDYTRIARLSRELKPGYIWVTSGATEIGRLDYLRRHGRELEGKMEDVKADYSAEGQSILMSTYRQYVDPRYSIRQVLVEHQHFNDPLKREFLKSLLLRCKEQNAIPIVNYNDAVCAEENRKMEIQALLSAHKKVVECVDNDETAAQIACLVKAETLLILTSTDGIYKDLKKGELVEEIGGKDVCEVLENIDYYKGFCSGVSRAGANGAGAKLEYIKDAVKQGTKVIIANGKYSIKEVLSGAVPATRICVR